MENLAVKHGYYFLVDKDDEEKVFNVIIGKGYQNDDVSSFSITSENGFLVFYVNGQKDAIRDQDLSKEFEQVVDEFLDNIIEAYGTVAVMKMEDGKFVQYYTKDSI